MDFRKDTHENWKLRSFHSWLQEGIRAESIDQAVNIIGKRLEEYQWALKKHGLQTFTGEIKTLLNLKNSGALFGGTMVANYIGGDVWAALTSVLSITGYVTSRIIEIKTNIEALQKESYPEVVLLNDANRFLQKN
ncbi:MAG: hypothetical protein ACYC4Q_07925 [Victivallaceae bacterium]